MENKKKANTADFDAFLHGDMKGGSKFGFCVLSGMYKNLPRL
jgi:hypothetical protein